jgi:glycosyltransferase involved in cell wall biosynthesis/O-antigen/teichoic acid export membrane protein
VAHGATPSNVAAARRGFGDEAWYVIATVIVNLSNFGFHVIVSRLLGPSQYGAISALLNIVTIAGLVFGIVQATVIQEVVVRRNEPAGMVIRYLVRGAFFVAVGVAVAFAVFSPLTTSFLAIGSIFPVLFLSIWFIPTISTLVMGGTLMGRLRFKAVAVASIAGACTRLVVTYALTSAHAGLNGPVIGSVAGVLVPPLILLIVLRTDLAKRDGTPVQVSGRTMAPTAVGLAGVAMLTGVDTVLARHFLSPLNAGLYASAATAGRIALFLPSAVTTLVFPRFVADRASPRAARRNLFLSLGIVGVVGLFAAAVMTAVPHLVTAVLFGRKFANAAAIIPILAVQASMIGMVSVLVYYHLARRSRLAGLPLLSTFAVIVIVWSQRPGAEGLAFVMLAVTSFTVLLMGLPALRPIVVAEVDSLEAVERPAGPDSNVQHDVLDLTLVLPSYNPGPRLRAHTEDTLATLRHTGVRFELICVSDGSTDGADAGLEALGPEVNVVRLPENAGKGHALQVGFALARGSYVGFIDGDGDIPAAVLGRFVDCIRSELPDILVGSKRHRDSDVVYPPLRRVYSTGFQLLTRALLGLKVKDSQSGLKIARREVIEATLPVVQESGFTFDLEFLGIAHRLGFNKVVELPITIRDRFTTSISVHAVWTMFLDTVGLAWRIRVARHYDKQLYEIASGRPSAVSLSRIERFGLSGVVKLADEEDSYVPVTVRVPVPSRIEHLIEPADVPLAPVPLKILLCNWRDLAHPRAGGAEVWARSVCLQWLRMGHEVTWFCAHVDGVPSEEVVEGIRIVRRGSMRTVYSEARAFYESAGPGAFDLVVDEMNTRPFMSVQWTHAGTKVLPVSHQLAREVWFYETAFPIAMLGRYVLEPWWLHKYRHSRVVTISESSRRWLGQMGIGDVVVVPVGFEPGRSIVAAKERHPTLLYLGRLSANKRPDHVIEAFKVVSQRFPDAQLWVVGTGPMQSRLEQSAPPGVRFFGRVDQATKRELIAKSHVLVMTSVREGWGLTVTEAAELGVPTIGYTVAGLEDSVPLSGGWLVTPDIEALATQIVRSLPELVDGTTTRDVAPRGVLRWSEVATRLLAAAGFDGYEVPEDADVADLVRDLDAGLPFAPAGTHSLLSVSPTGGIDLPVAMPDSEPPAPPRDGVSAADLDALLAGDAIPVPTADGSDAGGGADEPPIRSHRRRPRRKLGAQVLRGGWRSTQSRSSLFATRLAAKSIRLQLRRVLTAVGLAALFITACTSNQRIIPDLFADLAIFSFLIAALLALLESNGGPRRVRFGLPLVTGSSRDWRRAGAVVVAGTALAAQSWFRLGTVIGGGDKVPPAGVAWLSRLFSQWTWNGSTLGSASQLIQQLPWALVLWTVHSLGGSIGMAQRIFATLLFAGAALAMLWLCRLLGLRPVPSAIAAFVYVISPATLTVIGVVPARLTILLLMPLCPAIVVATQRHHISLLTSAFLFVAVAPMMGFGYASPPDVLLPLGSTLAVLAYVRSLEGRHGRTRLYVTAAVDGIASLAASAYWILPGVLHAQAAPTGRLAQAQAWVWTEGRSTPTNALWLNTAWGWKYPAYAPYAGQYNHVPLVLLKFAIPAVALSALMLRTERRTARPIRQLRLTAVMALFSLFFVMLATGTRQPGNLLFDSLYRLPFGWVLREPGRFLPLAAFGYVILIAISIGAVTTGSLGTGVLEAVRARRSRQVVGVLVTGLVLVLPGYPLVTGQVINTANQQHFGGHVTIPSYWTDMGKVIDAQPGNGAVMMLPTDNFYAIAYGWGYYGADNFMDLLMNRYVVNPSTGTDWTTSPVLTRTDKEVVPALLNHNWSLANDLLGALRSPYLLVRGDLIWDWSQNSEIPPARIAAVLRADPYMTLVATKGPLLLFHDKSAPGTGLLARPDYYTTPSSSPDLRILQLLGSRAALIEHGPITGVPMVLKVSPMQVWGVRRSTLTVQEDVQSGWTYRLAAPDSQRTLLGLKQASRAGSGLQATIVSSVATLSMPIGQQSLEGSSPLNSGWGRVGDCANFSPKTADLSATALLAGNPYQSAVLQLQARGDEACMGRSVRNPGGYYRVFIGARWVSGNAPFACLFEQWVQRCVARFVFAKEPKAWQSASAIVYVPAGEPTRLTVRAAGSRSRTPTVVQFAGWSVRRLPSNPGGLALVGTPNKPHAHSMLYALGASSGRGWVAPKPAEPVTVDGLASGWLVPRSTAAPHPVYAPGVTDRHATELSLLAGLVGVMLFAWGVAEQWLSRRRRRHRPALTVYRAPLTTWPAPPGAPTPLTEAVR